MKLSRRILSAFLALLMVCSVITTVSAAGVTFTDVSGHWAWTNGSIPYLVDKGVLNGYKQPNGTYKFMPDGQVTRAEFIKMLDETFGLTETAAINFSDVKSNDWFYQYFAKAEAQGYLLNYGTSANPNGKLTREEALALLVRYLDLPASEKSDTSYFSDYYSISETYRDYILRGVASGLTEGSMEGGARVFKPKSTISRAEALTLLYRAAGCIFNLNAYSRDNSAAPTNNVITRGGVILNGIKLNGRVIITEGANSGTVALSGCSADTLYVRGTADVTLDNCKIDTVVVSKGCKLSLLNETEVKNITLYGKSALGIYSGISVDVLDVSYGADRSSVTGNGIIGMAYVNASGFMSSIVPSEFQIGKNLTASFNGSEYQGSSDEQESFTMTPFVTSDSANYYLNLFPAVSGKVYYYFTNGAGIPNTSSFDEYYVQSSVTGVIDVNAGEIKTEKTYSAASVKNFDYVVLQLQADGRKYAPVLIPNTNTDGSGFTTIPFLADETTVKFVSGEPGTLYWYYSESGEKMNQAQFLQNYSKTDSALRASSDGVVSGRTQSIALNTKYLKNYDYVVLMLKNAAGSYYTPVVVSAGDDGFTDGPALKNVGTVSFKTDVSGELYYYFSENADLPAPDDYKSEYNRVNGDLADHLEVKKNSAGTFDYDTDEVDDYPYLIIAIKNSSGDWMQPVALDINYSTGFRNEPEIYNETTIKFRTEDDGDVMYYYTKSDVTPSIEDFEKAYSNTGKSYKDTVDVDDSWESIEYSKSKAQDYPYMAFMFIDDQDNAYSPVVISLDVTDNTGFKISPYIVGDTVYFTTLADGEVWYYYAKTDDSVATYEFEDDYDDADEYGTRSASEGVFTGFELEDEDYIDDYPYLVLAFLPEKYENSDDKKFSYPVVLNIKDAATSGSGLTVGSISDTAVWVTTGLEGRLYYYFTNTYSNPGDNFESRYNSNDGDNEICDKNDQIKIDVDDVTEDYLVICLAVEDGSDEIFLAPVVVNLDERTSSEDAGDDSTTTATGLLVTDIDYRDHIITFTALDDGEVTVSLAAGIFKTTCATLTVEEDEEYEFDFDSYVTSDIIEYIIETNGTGAKLTLQLVSSDETYRSVSYEIIQ